MGGVEAGQVFQARQIGEVVQGDDGETGARSAFMQGTKDATADTAVAVQGNSVRAVRHCYPLFNRRMG
ncbi:hypothetical protein D3C78_1673940 [compost metagenome]